MRPRVRMLRLATLGLALAVPCSLSADPPDVGTTDMSAHHTFSEPTSGTKVETSLGINYFPHVHLVPPQDVERIHVECAFKASLHGEPVSGLKIENKMKYVAGDEFETFDFQTVKTNKSGKAWTERAILGGPLLGDLMKSNFWAIEARATNRKKLTQFDVHCSLAETRKGAGLDWVKLAIENHYRYRLLTDKTKCNWIAEENCLVCGETWKLNFVDNRRKKSQIEVRWDSQRDDIIHLDDFAIFQDVLTGDTFPDASLHPELFEEGFELGKTYSWQR